MSTSIFSCTCLTMALYLAPVHIRNLDAVTSMQSLSPFLLTNSTCWVINVTTQIVRLNVCLHLFMHSLSPFFFINSTHGVMVVRTQSEHFNIFRRICSAIHLSLFYLHDIYVPVDLCNLYLCFYLHNIYSVRLYNILISLFVDEFHL